MKSTNAHDTTPSILDYVGFKYIVQAGDGITKKCLNLASKTKRPLNENIAAFRLHQMLCKGAGF